MKKLSLLKKIRLAFMAEGWLVKLIIMIYPMTMLFTNLDDEGFLQAIGIIFYGIVVASMSLVYMSIPTGNLKMYKTMPMTTADIVDIMSAHVLIGVLIMAVPPAVFLSLSGNPEMLPYYLCADCVFLAMTSTAIVWYAKDRYAYGQAKDRNDEEAVIKKNTHRVAWTAVGYMLVEGAVGLPILWQSINPDPAADMSWLIAVSAVGLIIYTAIALGARKIKNAFMY